MKELISNKLLDETEELQPCINRTKEEENFKVLKESLEASLKLKHEIEGTITSLAIQYNKLLKIKLIVLICTVALLTAFEVLFFTYSYMFIIIPLVTLALVISLLKLLDLLAYRLHMKKIDLANLTLDLEQLLIEHEAIINKTPHKLLRYLLKQNNKSKAFERGIYIVCKNNKALRHKLKATGLLSKKGIFESDEELLDTIVTIEDNFFNTIFAYYRKNTLKEAVDKYFEIVTIE